MANFQREYKAHRQALLKVHEVLYDPSKLRVSSVSATVSSSLPNNITVGSENTDIIRDITLQESVKRGNISKVIANQAESRKAIKTNSSLCRHNLYLIEEMRSKMIGAHYDVPVNFQDSNTRYIYFSINNF